MRQTPFAGERGKLTLSQLQSEFRGPLQMIKGRRPIPRSVRFYANAEREIMRNLRLGFPHRKTRNDRFSYATTWLAKLTLSRKREKRMQPPFPRHPAAIT